MRFKINTYFLCILLYCAHSLVWAENIKNIRIGVKKKYTRIVFDLDKAPNIYNVKYLTSPDRIILDFTQGSIEVGVIKNTSAYPLINKINGINILDSGFNIEIELQQSANFKHFVLPPSKNAGYRLVLDITPGIHITKEIKKDEPSTPQTIIPKVDKKSIPRTVESKNNITDYKSDRINLYDNDILTDAKIEQLFQSLHGNTQLKKSYYIDTVKQKKEKHIAKDSKKISNNVPQFDVRGYKIKGNTLLSLDKLKSIIKPFTGKKKNFSDVQHALESLEQAYQNRGYGMVQVYLPEQELAKGIILFNVIEPKIKSLSVQGAKFFDLTNIQKSIVSLEKGKTPNTKDISENLLLVNENPAKKTTIQFLPSEEEGVLNTLINVKDKKPSIYSMTLDNTGTESTGYYRLGVAYQDANLTNNDDILNLQYTTSDNTTLHALGLSYHYPLYNLNSTIDLFGGYSTVDSGVVEGLFDVSGKGTVFGARYNQILPKVGNYFQRLAYGFDYKDYKTDVVDAMTGLTTSDSSSLVVKPLSLTYSGQWTNPTSASGFNMQVHYNAFASQKDEVDYSLNRVGAEPNYLIYRYGLEHAQSFAKKWQMRLAVSGQLTSNGLISGEQFGIGGANSVRGYNERDISSDTGFQATAEIYTPNYADSLWMKGADARFLFFYDIGQVDSNLSLPAEDLLPTKLKSVGIGFRVNYKDKFSFKLDVASPLLSSMTQYKGDTKIHATLNYIF